MLALQSDGKIVVAGFGDVLVRFNPDGSLGTGFGSEGKVTTRAGFGARALALQADGNIIAAGVQYLNDFDFALHRYTSDGTLDTSFGTAGMVHTDFGKSDDAYGLIVQADGKIVLAGRSWDDTGSDFALARYDTSGSLDTNFGTGGILTTDFAGYDAANAVALQADGKIVVAGNAGVATDFGLARYWP